MFDLNKSIAAWRRRYEHDRSFLPEDIRELEQHVRDQVAALVGEGRSEEESFFAVMREIGEHEEVRAAYRDVRWGKLKREHTVTHHLSTEIAMLKNYLKVALRNVRRQKGYAFINIAGLSIGLACSFFILLWIMQETSVDRFHESGDRIHRVWRNVYINGEIHTWGATPGPLGDMLTTTFPEVENATYTYWGQDFLITSGDQSFREQGNYAGADFFEVFTFPLVQGDPATALQSENSVVISERLAARLFGADWRNGDVVGKTVTVDHDEDFTITAVAADVPGNSTIKFDVLLPMQEFFAENEWTQQWGNNSFPLYVRLKEGASLTEVNKKIAGLIQQHAPEQQRETLFLQPFEEAYLHGKFRNGESIGGRINLIRIFGVVAVFLLIIAAINFMNLATARSTQRSKEVGVRKAIGASQQSLMGQFMAETMLLATGSFVLAVAAVLALLPTFNQFIGQSMDVGDFSLAYVLGALGIALATGLLAGSYPALYLSSFNPVTILRGTFRQKPGAERVRKGLVVFQFALSTLFIVCTVATYVQIRYIMEKDLGLNKESVVTFPLEGNVGARYESFRQELMKQPGVVNVSTSSYNPLFIGSSTSNVTWEGRDPDDETEFSVLNVNYDFVETMDMQMAAGRSYARQYGADSAGYLINEQIAKLMGKQNPVGERLTMWGQDGQVIGVVKDFHMASMENPISPTVIRLDPSNTSWVWVRIEQGQTQEALAGLEGVYTSFNPEYPLDYSFLDQEYKEMYRSIVIMGKLTNVFAVVAILISCLGLFGLAAFTAERRTKELGVRKVLGASPSHLFLLLSSDFTKLVLLGFLLAVPVAYWLIQTAMSSFEYHARISPWMFATAGATTLLIAWLTVGYRSIKAALADPVKSLRYE